MTSSATNPRAARLASLPRATLVEREDITEDLMVLKFRPENSGYTFKPGQYCTLGADGIERAYSIASAPYEGVLEVFVELVGEGELTPRMWNLHVGDTMSMRPTAKGLFVMKDQFHHHVMVSTVTGVAPTVSMVRQYIHDQREGHVFYILYGASYQDELTYDTELAGLAQERPDCITFIPTVSRPDEPRNAGWTGARGRVNNIFQEYLDGFDLPHDDTMIYACGHPGMIASVKDQATPAGWNFIEERFWKE